MIFDVFFDIAACSSHVTGCVTKLMTLTVINLVATSVCRANKTKHLPNDRVVSWDQGSCSVWCLVENA